MSQSNETGHITELPDEDILMRSRVKKTATGVALAGAVDKTYASATAPGYGPVAGEKHETMSVKAKSASGTHEAIAAGAMDPGDEIQGAANGEVAQLSGGTAIGLCLSTATAQGDHVEVIYYNN